MRVVKPKFKVGDVIRWDDTSLIIGGCMLITQITGAGSDMTYHGIDLINNESDDWITVNYADTKMNARLMNPD